MPKTYTETPIGVADALLKRAEVTLRNYVRNNQKAQDAPFKFFQYSAPIGKANGEELYPCVVVRFVSETRGVNNAALNSDKTHLTFLVIVSSSATLPEGEAWAEIMTALNELKVDLFTNTSLTGTARINPNVYSIDLDEGSKPPIWAGAITLHVEIEDLPKLEGVSQFGY